MKKIESWILVTLCLVLQSGCDQADEANSSQTAQKNAFPTSPASSGAVPLPTAGPIPSIDDIDSAPGDQELESLDQRASYGIGYRIGTSILGDENIQVDQNAILSGLKDGLERRQRLTEAEMIDAARGLVQRAGEKLAEVNEERSDEAIAFLTDNAQRLEVQMTSSGLQYEILTEPDDPEGPRPTLTDSVTVDYHGTLLDGTVFDSSIERGEPLTLALRGVIPGWIEALKLMTPGEKRRVYLPPALGYGSKGAGSVPPYAVLIFDLELKDIPSAEVTASAGKETIPFKPVVSAQ